MPFFSNKHSEETLQHSTRSEQHDKTTQHRPKLLWWPPTTEGQGSIPIPLLLALPLGRSQHPLHPGLRGSHFKDNPDTNWIPPAGQASKLLPWQGQQGYQFKHKEQEKKCALWGGGKKNQNQQLTEEQPWSTEIPCYSKNARIIQFELLLAF